MAGGGTPPPIEVRLATQHTILDEMRSAGPGTTGFDYLRIGLATAVLTWHSIILSTGSAPLDRALWSGPFRFLPAAILPMFFALSGFILTYSYADVPLRDHVWPMFLRDNAMRVFKLDE